MKRLLPILPVLVLILSGCQTTVVKKLDFKTFILEHKNATDLFLVRKSRYIKGVTDDQWAIIKKLGDPMDCEKKVKELDNTKKGKLIEPKDLILDAFAIEDSLNRHDVIILAPGTYYLNYPILVPPGKTLIGRDGAIIDGTNVGTAIHNNGYVKNLGVKNAQKYGIKLGSNSLTYKVIIRYSGILPPSSSQGNGLHSNGGNSHDNCVVSVEASHGYNQYGSSPITEKGGNADGFTVKYGAHNITFIDTHAHHNSDDGYDFWKSGANVEEIGKTDKSIRIFYSSATLNGKNPFTQNGDGNGFKFGSYDGYQVSRGKDRGARFIYGSAACYNKKNGFDRNRTSTQIIKKQLDAAGNQGGIYIGPVTKEEDKFRVICASLPKD